MRIRAPLPESVDETGYYGCAAMVGGILALIMGSIGLYLLVTGGPVHLRFWRRSEMVGLMIFLLPLGATLLWLGNRMLPPRK